MNQADRKCSNVRASLGVVSRPTTYSANSVSSSGRKCFDTTNPMIRIGVARTAPIGPHNHVQNARAEKTIRGLRLRLQPTISLTARGWPPESYDLIRQQLDCPL